MGIFDLPFFDRPSYKLKKKGPSFLSEPELLSILLWKGKKEGVLDLSNRLIKKYNLDGLEYIGFNELKKECKKDEVKVLKILALIELSKRYNKLKNKGYQNKSITSAGDVFNIC